MQIRKYKNFSVIQAATLISSEVINNNKSIGWSGSVEELEAVKVMLVKYNIHYIDDISGEWQHR
jgi:hypothetical protein